MSRKNWPQVALHESAGETHHFSQPKLIDRIQWKHDTHTQTQMEVCILLAQTSINISSLAR